MEEAIKVKQIIVGLTLITGLLSWLFITQGNNIETNRQDIKAIQLNDNTHEILIRTLLEDKLETKQDLKDIKGDINEIKLAIEKLK